jgi:hypothetical protein
LFCALFTSHGVNAALFLLITTAGSLQLDYSERYGAVPRDAIPELSKKREAFLASLVNEE